MKSATLPYHSVLAFALNPRCGAFDLLFQMGYLKPAAATTIGPLPHYAYSVGML